MFKVLFSLLSVLVISGFTFAAEIVFIDIQKIVRDSVAGKEAQSILENMAKKAQEEISQKEKALKPGDQKAQEELQGLAVQKQQEILAKREELIQSFMKNVQDNITSFAKAKNYTLIIDKQAVLYGKDELDKTDEFLKYFDENYKKSKK